MDGQSLEQENPAAYFFWLQVWCKTIAVVQVAGGLVGIFSVVSKQSDNSGAVVTALAFVFFLLALVAGVLLALGKRLGILLSLGVQALQLFQVSAATVFYSLACGPKFVVGYYTGDNGINLGLGWALASHLRLSWNMASAPVSDSGSIVVSLPPGAVTGLNLVALSALVCLLLARGANRGRRRLPG